MEEIQEGDVTSKSTELGVAELGLKNLDLAHS